MAPGYSAEDDASPAALRVNLQAGFGRSGRRASDSNFLSDRSQLIHQGVQRALIGVRRDRDLEGDRVFQAGENPFELLQHSGIQHGASLLRAF